MSYLNKAKDQDQDQQMRCGTCSRTNQNSPPTCSQAQADQSSPMSWDTFERSPDEPRELTETTWSLDKWEKIPIQRFLELKSMEYLNDEGKYQMIERMLPFLDCRYDEEIWKFFTNHEIAEKVFILLGINKNVYSGYVNKIIKSKYFCLNGEIILLCEKNKDIIRIYPDRTVHIVNEWPYNGEKCKIEIKYSSGTSSLMYRNDLQGQNIQA